MIRVLILVFAAFYISVHGNTERDSCGLLEEYENFKVSLDTFFASNDEICKNKHVHSDCASIKEEFPEATDGVYRIKPRDGKPSFLAYCDMTSKGGGWLVIQRRQDGSEDFYRTWFEYMDGFGNLTGEFWLGNEKIHRLTSQRTYKLRVDLQNAKGNTAFAEYTKFRVASMSEFYNLTIVGYTGNASDSLTRHDKNRFTARNLDLDKHGSKNCATLYRGAWWYKDCIDSNLNGVYTANSYGVWWRNFGNSKKTTMKIRPVH